MTKEELLVKEALYIENKYGCIDWHRVSELEKQAESEETKQFLHDMATRMYHIEEYYAGLL